MQCPTYLNDRRPLFTRYSLFAPYEHRGFSRWYDAMIKNAKKINK